MSQPKKNTAQNKARTTKPKKVYRPKVQPDKKKQQLIQNTQRHNAIEPAGQVTDGMTLPAQIEDTVLQQIYQATVSYLFAFGGVTNYEQSSGVPSSTAFTATAYLLDGLITYASGSVLTEKMPHIHAIIATMLRQRQLRFRYGNVVYTPTIAKQTLNTTMILSNGDVFFSVPPDTTSNLTITSPAATILPDEEDYSRILSCYTRKECPLSSIVNVADVKQIYTRDPSAFARNYAYVGSNGTTKGGLINDAELEIPFKMPTFSKFVIYNPEDTQIARILKLQSGGIAQNIAYSLTDTQFHEQHFKNPIPTIYKFLDLNEFFLYTASWLARAMSNVAVTSNNPFIPQTLPMSKFDYMILLRQAILTQFTASQLQGQFLQPVSQSSGNPNLFRPLVMDPATIPSPAYAGFMLPSILKENLSMLKEASYLSPRSRKDKPSAMRVTYVPVWGFYDQDEIPDVVVAGADESSFPLFQSTSVLPTYSSITDLRTSNSNIKVNPNSQQAIALLQTWNSFVSTINGLTQVSSISSDVNYTGNLLIYTRIQEAVEKQATTTALKVQDPSTKYIKNTITYTKGKETKVKVVQSALLYTTTILSIKPVPQELTNNLFALFLPTLRLDLNSPEDKLTQPTWQTYTGEIASQPYEFSPGAGGISMTSRAYNTAGRMITAQFAPSNEQDTLAQAMQALAKHSWGADLFGQIVSGLLGMVPVVGPALGSAVSAFF
jgi:hypothetical protein